MRLNKLRGSAGFWMGEIVQAGLLSLGLVFFSLIALNGFNTRATIHFLDNFSSRFLTAETAQANGVSTAIQLAILTITIIILGVRFVDRRSKKRVSE